MNIEGKTIHSLFRIPYSFKDFGPLNGETGRKYQLEQGNLKFLIIDEMSMIGVRLLAMIEKRCRELRTEIDEPFGGIHVFLFGDFKQLPPVGECALYNENVGKNDFSVAGSLIIRNFQSYLELHTSHRQSTDPVFVEALDRLSEGEVTPEDYELFFSRRQCVLSDEELEFFDNEIHLFPTNIEVKTYNDDLMQKQGRPVCRMLARDNPEIATSDAIDVSIGLLSVLNLSLGTRVMLRQNLWVSGGLVNGSCGTVISIVFKRGETAPSLPAYILAEFDDYKGPFLQDTYFPIIPVSRSWTNKGFTFTRTQFPIMPAHALTIHKAQGLTLSKVAVDIGRSESPRGISYVALNRVKELSKLLLLKNYPVSRLTSINENRDHKIRRDFLSFLISK